jgi:hypothetical protein
MLMNLQGKIFTRADLTSFIFEVSHRLQTVGLSHLSRKLCRKLLGDWMSHEHPIGMAGQQDIRRG